jgi:hypothetical protein
MRNGSAPLAPGGLPRGARFIVTWDAGGSGFRNGQKAIKAVLFGTTVEGGSSKVVLDGTGS